MMKRIGVAVFAAIFLLAFTPQAWQTILDVWTWINPPPQHDDAVASGETAEQLSAKGLRNQLISFDNLVDIDHGKYQLYAMGVGQVTLIKPEKSPNAKVRVTGSRIPRRDYSSNSPLTTVTGQQVKDSNDVEATRPYQVYGQFNNVLIFDRKADGFTSVFDKRMAISRFQTGWRTPQDILIVIGTDTDSNHDGNITSADLESVYIYSFADKQVHRIDAPGMSAESIVDMPNANYLIVQYRVDRNHDGEIGSSYSETGQEPAAFMRIDLKTYEARPFVPLEMVDKLQKTLEAIPAAQH
jgi:hypothetical protein